MESTPTVALLPSMLTSARPSAPTATPCGIDGRTTLATTASCDRSMTLSRGEPLAVWLGVAPLVT